MENFAGQIVAIDLLRQQHADAVIQLLDEYARHPLGGGLPLADNVRQRLIADLRELSSFRGLLAEDSGRFVGVVICFLGYSTFGAYPLLNIHDLAVTESYRGRKVGSTLLREVEQLATAEGCGAITLEVRADNPAQRLYLRHGFEPGDPLTDAMSFWKKKLSRRADLGSKSES